MAVGLESSDSNTTGYGNTAIGNNTLEHGITTGKAILLLDISSQQYRDNNTSTYGSLGTNTMEMVMSPLDGIL